MSLRFFAWPAIRQALAQAASSAVPKVPVIEGLEGRRLFSSAMSNEEYRAGAQPDADESGAALLEPADFTQGISVEVTNGDYSAGTPSGSGTGGMATGSDRQSDSDKDFSEDPVRYYDGQIKLEAVDLVSDGFGKRWGQSRSWTNDDAATFGEEVGWMTRELPSIVQVNNGSTVITLDGSTSRRYFDLVGSDYVPRHFVKDRLTLDATNGEFVLTDTVGNQIRYMDFSTARPSAQRGLFKSFTDARGNSISVLTYNAQGRVGEVQRTDSAAGVTESFVYSYISGGGNDGLLSGVTLRRQTGGGSWQTVRQVEYRYYDGTTANGNVRDLETAIVKDANGATVDQHYYRYYKAGETGGYERGLKFVFTPKSHARMAAAVGTVSTATDAQIAPYADYKFEYDATTHRVTRQDIARWGSSESSGGRGTYTYAYSDSPNTDPNPSAVDYNVWRYKTVETLPDGNQNIVYCNEAGQVMLKVYRETSSGNEWRTFWKYGTDGRTEMKANPSAVTTHDETKVDLLNFSDRTSDGVANPDYQHLADNAGLIETTSYFATTDATQGAVAGYVQSTSLRRGEVGAATLQESYRYDTRSNTGGSVTIHPLDTITRYRNTDGTGAQVTDYNYTWLSGTVGIASLATVFASVSEAQNGPGTSDQEANIYDSYGRATWTRDAAGFIERFMYDEATGAVETHIADVDTALTADEPTGWTTPTGGGLHLQTLTEIDSLGRATKIARPQGGGQPDRVTYFVYNDPDHEMRVYHGWIAGSNRPTGPTVVAREDRARGYVESFTMTAAPDVSAGRPRGTEGVSGLQSLVREHVNAAGQVVTSDRYFNLTGLTYSTAAGLGANGTNFYRTSYGYDDRGVLNRSVAPTGTVTRVVYDGQRRALSAWVGTDDTPTAGTWSPTNNAGANMTVVSEYEYDDAADTLPGGGIGDGNVTKVTEHPGGGAPDRVTRMFHDWRNRVNAVKAGVQASGTEAVTLGVQRQIVHYTYDNLDQPIQWDTYDGDNVTLSDSDGNGIWDAPVSSARRSRTTTAYDDLGRVHRQTSHNVVQSGTSAGDVTGASVSTHFWYDRRDNVIKIAAAGGPVEKFAYDGAGRLTTSYATDGGGDAGPGTGGTWTGANDVIGDVVLEQTETKYDASGNPIFTITKQRFHDAAGTGELADATSATHGARVSYTASFYDDGDRLVGIVDLGTNGGGSALTARPDAQLPPRSNTKLVTSFGYDDAGNVGAVTDPRGNVTRTMYDALGRATSTVENADADADTLPGNAEDRTTEYTYDGSDNLLTLKAVLAGGGSQETRYLYGVDPASGSAIHSNDVLAGIQYPDKSSGAASSDEQEDYDVNALGEVTSFTDRSGTVHAYSYDVLGRPTADVVTSLGGGVDGQVRRVAFSYDGAGRPQGFSSYGTTAGSDGLLNSVTRDYNGFSQLVTETQADSRTGGGAAPAVQYTYSEAAGGANHSRLTRVTYPNGRQVDYNYGAANSTNDRISRLENIAEGASVREGYTYLGLSTAVKFTHPETGVDLTYIKQSGESNGDAGDQYTGLDRFGRVADQRWIKAGTDIDRFRYGYDENGNRLYKENVVAPTKSELYAYDNLDRLKNFDRGTVNQAKNGIDGAPTREQDWTLDALGNWSTVSTESQTRQHNKQNQLTSVESATLTYDENGNLMKDESGKTFTYDAWNRLMRVYGPAGNLLVRYEYDGLGRRIAESDLRLSGTAVTITGTSASETFRIAKGATAGTLELYRNGNLEQTITGTELLLRVDGGGGNDTLNVESGTIHLVNDANVSATNLALNVSDPDGTGTVVTIASDRQHLASLSISSGAKVELQAGRETVLVIGSGGLSVSGTGTLDLQDNDLIVRNGDKGTATNGTYDGVHGLVQRGYNYSAWDGAGLVTSQADAQAQVGLTTVAVADGSEVLFLSAGETGVWNGETVGSGDVLVAYTYAGDLNFDRVVDGADYGTISNWIQFPGTDGYANGDVNYDGVIDGADLGTLDTTIQLQSAISLDPAMRHLYYSAGWQVLEERRGISTDTQHVWSPRYVDAMVLRDRDSDGNASLDQRHYAQQDANFNVTSISDATGAVAERYAYDPYGTATILDASGSPVAGNESTVSWNYLHQGGRHDAASGLQHFRHRDYDAELGRWVQLDPAGFVDGSNLYEYVGSMPTSSVDPAGLFRLVPAGVERAAGPGLSRIGTASARWGTAAAISGIYYGARGTYRIVGGAQSIRDIRDAIELQESKTRSMQLKAIRNRVEPTSDGVGDLNRSPLRTPKRTPKRKPTSRRSPSPQEKPSPEPAATQPSPDPAPQQPPSTQPAQKEFDDFAERARAAGLVEHPQRRGKWGKIENGKFVEKARIDVAEPGKPGWRGKTHMHRYDRPGEHLPPDTELPG